MPTAKSKKRKPKKEANYGEVAEEVAIEEVANRRHSDSIEPLTTEPQDSLPQKKPSQVKKKKKKSSAIDPDADHADMANGDSHEPITDEEMTTTVTKKSKKKRKWKVTDPYSNYLGAEDDDIITDLHRPIAQRPLFSAAPPGHRQPAGKGFVERNRRFHLACADGRHSDLTEDCMAVRHLWSTRDVAVKVHCGFRVVGLYSHGFLAGYAAWNVMVVYVLAGEQLTTLANLLEQYHRLAQPFQSILYLLLAVSTVSAFDRVNLAKASMALRGFITLDPTAMASFLYFIALILSVSQQMTSDRIHLYPTANVTLWPPGSEQQVLQPWLVVNLVVALLVGLAWAFISTHPDLDYTEDFLKSMEVENFQSDENLGNPA